MALSVQAGQVLVPCGSVVPNVWARGTPPPGAGHPGRMGDWTQEDKEG